MAEFEEMEGLESSEIQVKHLDFYRRLTKYKKYSHSMGRFEHLQITMKRLTRGRGGCFGLSWVTRTPFDLH